MGGSQDPLRQPSPCRSPPQRGRGPASPRSPSPGRDCSPKSKGGGELPSPPPPSYASHPGCGGHESRRQPRLGERVHLGRHRAAAAAGDPLAREHRGAAVGGPIRRVGPPAVRCKAKRTALGGGGGVVARGVRGQTPAQGAHVGKKPRRGDFTGGGEHSANVSKVRALPFKCYNLYIYIYVYIYICDYLYTHTHSHLNTHTHARPSPTAWPRAALAPLPLAAANELLPIKSV